MMNDPGGAERTLGLKATTAIGVGAIVGGGVLALAGTAFAAAGPGAILAFLLNGLIALLTALSFAEMSSVFPESGGIYAFARRLLSLEAAFAFGWVVWFASIVAAVLYALGFGSYGAIAIERLWEAWAGPAPSWLSSIWASRILAVGATMAYMGRLMRKSSGVGQWESFGKVVLFAILIAGGLWALRGKTLEMTARQLSPFLPGGMSGVLQAMGYTFIALQGFDLIAAVAGEVRDPSRTIPRAMLLSLGIALAVYLPFLTILATAGMRPGESIMAQGQAHPEALVAIAVQNYLGPAGWWLVTLVAALSMVSALQANLMAASRVAGSMARDRTLPHVLSPRRDSSGTPVNALLATGGLIILIVVLVPDVAAAGAAASLIFLITFALAHGIGVVARVRSSPDHVSFRVPWFPAPQAVGGIACLALAAFQGFAVPAAGVIAAVWLICGAALFLMLFARRARIVDAYSEAFDPTLVRLRGRSPLVLVPIANPANAESMVAVANALAPPEVGRVLLLSVIRSPGSWHTGEIPPQFTEAQEVVREALSASFAAGLAPEALTTVSPRPWDEIARVVRTHRCESLLLGVGDLAGHGMESGLERLMGNVRSNIVLLRAEPGWKLSEVRRVLVAVGGRGDHDVLRARLLGSLSRTAAREIVYLRVLRPGSSDEELRRAGVELDQLARDEAPGFHQAIVIRSDDTSGEVVRYAEGSNLIVLGLKRISRRQKVLGDITSRIARSTNRAVIMISRRG